MRTQRAKKLQLEESMNILLTNYDEDITSVNDTASPVGDNLIDDYDNSEELDDLDIFMHNNNGNNRFCLHLGDYGSDYHSSGRHSFQNDWNSGSSPQSYDDSLDEQDEYDMMDDF